MFINQNNFDDTLVAIFNAVKFNQQNIIIIPS